jgi:hypothetical protein
MADALDWARSRRRYDIADLLLNHGAEPEQQDFQTVCERLDLTMMERHLRVRTDPNKDDVFARALSPIKARPLLGLPRSPGAALCSAGDVEFAAARMGGAFFERRGGAQAQAQTLQERTSAIGKLIRLAHGGTLPRDHGSGT